MKMTLAEAGRIVDGEVVGDRNIVITGVNGIKEAQKGDLTFVANSKYLTFLDSTQASAVIVAKNVNVSGKAAIHTQNPSLAFAKIASLFVNQESFKPEGIHKTAVIANDAQIGQNVAVGPYTVIESKAHIGDNTIIYSGCYIGHQTIIGPNALIYPNVSIRERISIGKNVIIHSGAVIGSDGFGFEQLAGTGVHEKIPQTGTVVIDDDVEIGANVTIDRARFDKTFIGKGTKIDNLVQIGHNVHIGERCVIVAQVGIAGSVKIGKGVIFAGQSGVSGHLTVGDGVIVAAQSGVMKSIPAHQKVTGFPARPYMHVLRINAALQKLPRYVKLLQGLKDKVEKLEKKLKKK